MSRDRFSLARPLQHKKLRQDSNCLQEDGERPEDLGEGEGVVEYEGQEEAGPDEVFDFECVDAGIVCWSELELHKIEDVDGGSYEEDLHEEVVERDPFVEQVEVA